MQREMKKNLKENSQLECLIFSLHVILFCTVFPGIHQRRNILIKNRKEYFDYSTKKERKKN
jgi:hypothetical protein